MTARRRIWLESPDPLMPWEDAPDSPRSAAGYQVVEQEREDQPVLYGPKGEPLGRPRARLGFQPPETRR